jgi:transcriptional regulator with XRE-family HTH domain
MNMLVDALDIMKQKSGKTLQQISDECGIPKGTLNKIFAGQTKDPQYGTLKNIVHALGFTVDDLEKFENPETKKSPAPAEAETEEVSLEETDRLLVALGLIKEGEQLSDDDLAFVGHIVGLLDAWFRKRK